MTNKQKIKMAFDRPFLEESGQELMQLHQVAKAEMEEAQREGNEEKEAFFHSLQGAVEREVANRN